MKQKEGEGFAKFVERLRKQAIRAEMTPEKEVDELRAALLERSLVGSKLAYELKLRQLTADELVMLGVELTQQLERERVHVQSITQKEEANGAFQSVPHSTKRKNEGYQGYQNQAKKFKPGTACRSCGKQHTGPCQAKLTEKLCWKCNRPGHFAVTCGANDMTKQPKQVHQVHKDEDGW